MGYIANPTDERILVASSTDNYTVINRDYAQERAERAQERLERDMRAVGFGARRSYCG
jgi:hypothetical protein